MSTAYFLRTLSEIQECIVTYYITSGIFYMQLVQTCIAVTQINKFRAVSVQMKVEVIVLRYKHLLEVSIQVNISAGFKLMNGV